MKESGIDRLTDAQRDVLRRWRRRQSAKEIGRDLGITHWAVNERLRSARRVLGADSSNEAARMLAEAEAPDGYNRIVYDPATVADPASADIMARSEGEVDLASGPSRGARLREERTPFRAGASYWPAVRLPLPRFRGDKNDLSLRSRLTWIGALALGIVITVGALITISWGVVRLVGQIFRTLS